MLISQKNNESPVRLVANRAREERGAGLRYLSHYLESDEGENGHTYESSCDDCEGHAVTIPFFLASLTFSMRPRKHVLLLVLPCCCFHGLPSFRGWVTGENS